MFSVLDRIIVEGHNTAVQTKRANAIASIKHAKKSTVAHSQVRILFQAATFEIKQQAASVLRAFVKAASHKGSREHSFMASLTVTKLKIGFLIPWITKSKGGTENVGQMMANAMVARGHDVRIFTFDNDSVPSRWPLDGRISLVHLPEGDDKRADDRMTVAVASFGPDLLVGLHMNRTMLRYVRVAHRVGVPLVLSEHTDPRYPAWIGTFHPDERDVAMAGATLIHLLSDGFVRTLDPSIQGKARVIPNTVPEPATLAEPGTQKDQHILLAVARLVPRKNIALVIEAFAMLARDFPDWHLQIVGDGPARGALERLAQTKGIATQVRFVGEQEDVYPFYAAADLFVIPSTIEGFPLTSCEAMAHGLPVIGLEVCGGVRDQVVNDQTGILCPDDRVITLAEAMRSLISDPSRRAAMGKAAHARFVEYCSNDIVHSAWEALFIEAVGMQYTFDKPDHQTLMSVRLWEQVWGPITKNRSA